MSNDMELAELAESGESSGPRSARELEAVYDIPVTLSAVLGKTITLTRSATTGWKCATTADAQYVAKGCGADAP